MLYRYETHCHTKEVSRCSRLSSTALVTLYRKLGYTGIVITDHFFNGNTTVPRKGMAWEDRVEMFMTGYRSARAEGEKQGLDVFFAWEYSYFQSDFLTYGLDENWLLAHPDVCDWTPHEYFDRVKADGAFLVHAHPLRTARYIKHISLFPDKIDTVEVDNASMQDVVNERDHWYAESFGFYKTAGSDTHFLENRHRFSGIDSPIRFTDIRQYGEELKKGNLKLFSLNLDGLL